MVLLDVGMVTRLSEMDQHNMLGLFTSLSGMDGQGVANAVLSFSGQSCLSVVCAKSDRCGAPWPVVSQAH